MAREICLEKQKKKRLSCHNEELLWKLKKSTEVANHLAVSTKRLSEISRGRNREFWSHNDEKCIIETCFVFFLQVKPLRIWQP